jgi:Ca-activated chloride channel homolog
LFLLDVSGSMDLPSRLPLVQEAMRLLLQRLGPDDRVAIVTYAGESQLMLPSTPVAESARIRHVLSALHAGGQTNGGAGIQLAYMIAKAAFVEGGANRIILCTDGDFNVGITDAETLSTLAAEQAKAGLTLSVFGFGRGYRIDARLEALAAQGRGRSGYVNTRREAERALAEEVDGLFAPIAREVKLQVVFNPALVAGYRLIGYEHNEQLTTGETPHQAAASVIGSGHTLTALYEIVPAPRASAANDGRDPWLTFKIDYQEPAAAARHQLEFPLEKPGGHFSDASSEFKFAAAVAAFGMILSDSPHKGTSSLDHVAAWAEAGRGEDPGGYRSEFIDLVHAAKKLEP